MYEIVDLFLDRLHWQQITESLLLSAIMLLHHFRIQADYCILFPQEALNTRDGFREGTMINKDK